MSALSWRIFAVNLTIIGELQAYSIHSVYQQTEH